MNLRLEIKRNSDGVVRTDVWKDWDHNDYWWEEGNAGCDCNRELFFEQAAGNLLDFETPCTSGRYSVRLYDADTNELLYED